MNRINLAYIDKLEEETTNGFLSIVSQSFNVDGEGSRLENDTIVSLVKAHVQAQNLVKQLGRLYQACTDFATGNMQPYIDEHDNWADEQTGSLGPFDPFEVLERCFNTRSVYDLPVKIEQYAELLTLTRRYSDIQKRRQQTVVDFFFTNDETGKEISLPASELAQEDIDAIDRLAAEQTIQDIEIDYALDGYNQFYETAASLFSAHTDGDIVKCSEAILSLFYHGTRAD